jgi:hypothetical protein
MGDVGNGTGNHAVVAGNAAIARNRFEIRDCRIVKETSGAECCFRPDDVPAGSCEVAGGLLRGLGRLLQHFDRLRQRFDRFLRGLDHLLRGFGGLLQGCGGLLR